MDERLRLEAEVRDNATVTLRKIARELDAIKETPGMANARTWMTAFNKQTSEFKAGTSAISTGMSAMGLGALAAGASFAGLAKSFTDFATRTSDMKEIGRQTGLTTNEVNQLRRAAQDLRVDPDQINGALLSWSANMEQFRRHTGDLYGLLSQFDPGFAAKLDLEKPHQQLVDMLGYLARMPDAARQRQWTELFLGSGDLAKLFAGGVTGLTEALDRAQRETPNITAAMEQQSKALGQSIIDFNRSWENFETTVGPTVFKELRLAADDFRSVFDQIEGTIGWLQQHKDHPVADALKAADDAEAAKAKEVGERVKGKTPMGLGLPKTWTDDLGLTDPKKPWSPDSPYWFDFHDTTPAPQPSPQADLKAMVEERDELRAKVEANRSLETPDAFAKSNARDLARIKELESQIAARDAAQPSPFGVLKRPEFGTTQPPDWAKGLLHKSAYRTDDDGDASISSGLGMIDLTQAVQVGTKSGVLAAFREMLDQQDAEKGGAPGVARASYGPEGGGSGRGAGRGGGRSAPGSSRPAKGALAANQKEAYDAARAQGLSDAAARALVANDSGEGLAVPHDWHQDGPHMSGGIAQWDPERAAAIKAKFGKLPWELSVADQTRAQIWEIQNNPRFAATRKALEGHDPRAMIGALVHNYESPKHADAAISRRLGYLEGFNPNAAASGHLRIKSAESTAGGPTNPAIMGIAQLLQAGGLPGGLNRFTAFNDRYHEGTGSMHAKGLAADLTLLDPSKSEQALGKIRDTFKAFGLPEKDFKVLNEYLHPSGRATAGHLHLQFNTEQAAQRALGAMEHAYGKARDRVGRGHGHPSEEPDVAGHSLIQDTLYRGRSGRMLDSARAAGLIGGSSGSNDGAVDINLRMHNMPPVRGKHIKSSGSVRNVNIRTGPSMTIPSYEA